MPTYAMNSLEHTTETQNATETQRTAMNSSVLLWPFCASVVSGGGFAKLRSERGITLTEILLAAGIALVIIAGIIVTDITRFRIEQEVNKRAGTTAPGEQQAALATIHFANELAPADRVVLVSSSSLLVRRPHMSTDPCKNPVAPPPTCLDNPANYQWDQYVLDVPNKTLKFYSHLKRNGCSVREDMAIQIEQVTFDYVDASQPPPGGEPFAAPSLKDNNLLSYLIRWNDGKSPARTHDFQGTVAIRAAPYSDVNAGTTILGEDSGTGLAPTAVSSPPAACT